jgi:hypothetical protein
MRTSIDHNQVLIEDKLAVRVNLLYDENREFRKFAGKDQTRGTISLTWKPFENTTFRVNHESYDIHRNIAPTKHHFDAGLLRWAAAGKPTVILSIQLKLGMVLAITSMPKGIAYPYILMLPLWMKTAL